MSATAAKKTKAATPLAAVPPPTTLGTLIDALATNRDLLSKISEEEKQLKAIKMGYEMQLLELLDKQGTDRAANERFSVSISCADVYSAPKEGGHWDVFMAKVVAKLKRWDLVQARISDPAMRELVELSGWDEKQLSALGLTKFAKRSISLRKQ